MKALISYYGGKQRIASKIVALIPRHTVYCEPFCGGGAVFWRKPYPNVTNRNFYREILNDRDERLITFFRVLQDQPEKLIEKLRLTLYSEAEHKKSGKILKNPQKHDEFSRAWAYYVNIHQSFSSQMFGGWRRAVSGPNGVAKWKNKLDKLHTFVNRLQHTYISCQDAIICIRQWDSPQTCFYLDPPYPGVAQGHYAGYTPEQFNALVQEIKSIQGSFLLSCYDFSEQEIPLEWERFEISTTCSASGKGRVNVDRSRKSTSVEMGNTSRTEIVYRKIQRDVRDDLRPLYDGDQLAMFV